MAAITLDQDMGALIFLEDKGGTISEPTRTLAKPAPAVMPRGAGDTYVATLALALAAGCGPPRGGFPGSDSDGGDCYPNLALPAAILLLCVGALMEGNKRVMESNGTHVYRGSAPGVWDSGLCSPTAVSTSSIPAM